MDNNAQVAPPINTQPQPVSPQRGPLPTKLVAILVALIVLVLGVVGYFVFQKSVGKNIKPYVFTVDGNQIPQDEVREIYSYYFSKATEGNFDRNTTLENIKNLYIENYILKNEFKKSNLDDSSLSVKLDLYTPPASLSDAPKSLLRLESENSIIREMLGTQSFVQVRSGDLLVVRFSQEISPQEIQSFEPVIKSILEEYGKMFDASNSPQNVIDKFKNDAQLKQTSGVIVDAVSFENVYASHPPLQGEEYFSAVFNTPPNKASNVFKSGSGMQTIYGLVFPTSPLPKSKYNDFRAWMAAEKNNVQVVTDFSSI